MKKLALVETILEGGRITGKEKKGIEEREDFFFDTWGGGQGDRPRKGQGSKQY